MMDRMIQVYFAANTNHNLESHGMGFNIVKILSQAQDIDLKIQSKIYG